MNRRLLRRFDRVFGRSKSLPYRGSVASALLVFWSMQIADPSAGADSTFARNKTICFTYAPACSLLPSPPASDTSTFVRDVAPYSKDKTCRLHSVHNKIRQPLHHTRLLRIRSPACALFIFVSPGARKTCAGGEIVL